MDTRVHGHTVPPITRMKKDKAIQSGKVLVPGGDDPGHRNTQR